MLALLLAATWVEPSYALDPNRTLTQCQQRIWQVPQGLPEAAIFSLQQTSDGFLWLGTQSELTRFDGVRFTPLRGVQGMSFQNAWIDDLHEDSRHRLWIASDGAGLWCLADGRLKRYTVADGLPSNEVLWVRSDPAGRVWAGSRDAVAQIGDSVQTYRRSEGLAGGAGAGCFDQQGALVVAGDGDQLNFWNGTRFESRRLESLRPDDSVQALLSARDGALWIGASRGLVRLVGQQEQLFGMADGLASDSVTCLAEGRDGCIWVGTKEGFSRLVASSGPVAIHGFDIDSFRARDGLSQSTVYSLCEDREGSLWVGTKHGLNQFSHRRTILYSTSEGLPSNRTGPVFQDSAGQIWVGTLDAGLARFDGRHFAKVKAENAFGDLAILSLAGEQSVQPSLGADAASATEPEPSGPRPTTLWVGSDRGLLRLRNNHVDKIFTLNDGLPDDHILSLCHDESGALWAGTSAGMARLVGDRFEQPVTSVGFLRAPVRALMQHGAGLLAAVDGVGLYRCAGGRLESLDVVGPSDGAILSMYEDSEGLIWLGVEGLGLLRMDDRSPEHDPDAQRTKVSRFTVKDGLFDDEISGIVADVRGKLWMACSKGIFAVPREDLLRFADGALERLKSTPFTPLDALRTMECQSGVQPAVCRTEDGRMWFPTVRSGLIVVDPDRLARTLPPTPVIIDEVIVNGAARKPDAVDRLPPGTSNISFRYTALSFIGPSRITFRYKLEGFDPDWVEAGTRREAFYTNLPPGDYRFRVTARVNDSSHEASPLAFAMQPHFYQTRWFLPLCAAVAIGAGWGAYRLRVAQLRRRLQAVVAERSRIARELHDTLLQGFSGVTMEMQALCTRLAPSEERETLEDIIDDAGACMRDARRSVAGLRNIDAGQTTLAEAIAETARQITETHGVRLRLAIDPTGQALSSEAQYHVLRIAQEALLNAVKHAKAGSIEVSVQGTHRQMRLTIVDDGVGFAHPGAMGPWVEGAAGSSGRYGIIGMRERASQIGAEFLLESYPGRGTTVSLLLPLHQTARDAIETSSA